MLDIKDPLSRSSNACDIDLNNDALETGSEFNCNELPQCSISGIQVNNAVIHDRAIQSGCMTEQWLHTNIMTFGLALIGYVSLNLARSFIVEGVKQHNGVFTYTANTDAYGVSDAAKLHESLDKVCV